MLIQSNTELRLSESEATCSFPHFPSKTNIWVWWINNEITKADDPSAFVKISSKVVCYGERLVENEATHLHIKEKVNLRSREHTTMLVWAVLHFPQGFLPQFHPLNVIPLSCSLYHCQSLSVQSSTSSHQLHDDLHQFYSAFFLVFVFTDHFQGVFTQPWQVVQSRVSRFAPH